MAGFLSKERFQYFWNKLKPLLNGKQDTLVSGTNIKTINNTSLLGSGNVDIQGGGSSVFVAVYGATTYQEVLDAINAGKTILISYVQSGANTIIQAITYRVETTYIKFGVYSIGGYYAVITLQDSNIWAFDIDWLKLASVYDIPSIDTSISDTSTNAVQNKVIKAYIDEREPSIVVEGDWHYRIYNDGSFEAWYGKDKVSITVNNTSGTLYRSNLMNLVLPASLTNQGTTEIISYSIGTGHNNYPVWSTVASKTATQINYYVLSGGSRNTSPNYIVNAYVYGLLTQE